MYKQTWLELELTIARYFPICNPDFYLLKLLCFCLIVGDNAQGIAAANQNVNRFLQLKRKASILSPKTNGDESGKITLF